MSWRRPGSAFAGPQEEALHSAVFGRDFLLRRPRSGEEPDLSSLNFRTKLLLKARYLRLSISIDHRVISYIPISSAVPA